MAHSWERMVQKLRISGMNWRISVRNCAFPQKWRHHIDVEWHVQCIAFRFVSGPKGPINRKYTFFPRILLVQRGPEDANQTNNRAVWVTLGSTWYHFGFTLGYFWVFEVTLG